MMTNPQMVITDLVKRFGKKVVLKKINLEINKGEYLVILGPTGAGKTTLLKILTGLVKPTKGKIYINGQDITRFSPEDRNMAYLPQTSDYSLFPYMNVWNNAVFSPKMKGEKTLEEIGALGNEVLDLVNLRHRYAAFPHELSGGMKQRVALARAIAADSDIFLLDEPLRALDARLRIILRTEIKKLVIDLDKTTFHVTHDQEEALAIADRILIINEGRIEQIGSPVEIYQHPKTLFAAFFFGTTNLIPAKLKERNSSEVKFSIGEETVTCLPTAGGKSESIEIAMDEYVLTIKADNIQIIEENNGKSSKVPATNEFSGQIREKYYLGKWAHLVIMIPSFPKQLTVAIPSNEMDRFNLDSTISIKIDSEDITYFNEPWARIKQLEDA
jgi:ABC-type Fe3+/spermidine/putrescine transport system ATPase subunit